jgi:SAM-dependent methyltransferase
MRGRARTSSGRLAARPPKRACADVFRGCTSVLDVGCGTGVFLDLLRERGIARRLGIDRDPEMVEEARARGHEAQIGDVRAALRTLGESFEGIHVSFVIETMDGEEGLAFLADCVCALRPAGTLVVCTLNPRNGVVRDGAFWFEPWAKRPWPLDGRRQSRACACAPGTRGCRSAHHPGRAARRTVGCARSALRRVTRAHAPDASTRRRAGPPVERRGGFSPSCRRNEARADPPMEYGALLRAWVEGVREGADEIWVPSTYCARMFTGAGIAPRRISARISARRRRHACAQDLRDTLVLPARGRRRVVRCLRAGSARARADRPGR